MELTRRDLVRAGAVGGLALAGTLAYEEEASGVVPHNKALRFLAEGNDRWASGRAQHRNQTTARRRSAAQGQRPFATVFGCIDSRVSPEIVFDRGVGDIFVVRTPAQAVDSSGMALGSLEFGTVEANVSLIMVLGHQRCGAITEAHEAISTGHHLPGHLQIIVDALHPAYDASVGMAGDPIDNMVRAQIRIATQRVRDDPQFAPNIANGFLRVVGGYYSLDTGRVEVIA
jgi:carbonic anhydrase